eukprot:624082-Hanusia_phi.AAC.10
MDFPANDIEDAKKRGMEVTEEREDGREMRRWGRKRRISGYPDVYLFRAGEHHLKPIRFDSSKYNNERGLGAISQPMPPFPSSHQRGKSSAGRSGRSYERSNGTEAGSDVRCVDKTTIYLRLNHVDVNITRVDCAACPPPHCGNFERRPMRKGGVPASGSALHPSSPFLTHGSTGVRVMTTSNDRFPTTWLPTR